MFYLFEIRFKVNIQAFYAILKIKISNIPARMTQSGGGPFTVQRFRELLWSLPWSGNMFNDFWHNIIIQLLYLILKKDLDTNKCFISFSTFITRISPVILWIQAIHLSAFIFISPVIYLVEYDISRLCSLMIRVTEKADNGQQMGIVAI